MPKKAIIKKLSTIIAITFLSAGCSLFGAGSGVAGVFKSVNGGADWLASNTIKDSKSATLTKSNIAKLAFDPQNRQIVYAGSYTDGLYKSEDSGASWSRILSKILVYDFVISPNDSKTIYVSGSFDGQGKVLKTADGGASWQEIYNEAVAGVTVRGLDLNPSASTQLVIGTSSGSVIKSSDGGLSWQLVANFDDQVNKVLWRSGGVYVLLKNKGLYKGSAAADNFQNITAKLLQAVNTGFVNTSNLVFNQAYVDPLTSNLIYVTTNQSLYKSTDDGGTWTPLALPTKQGDNNSVIRAVTVAPSSSNIVFVSVGPIIYKSTNGGSTWQTQRVATGGYINYILIDPQLPQIAYAGAYVAQ